MRPLQFFVGPLAPVRAPVLPRAPVAAAPPPPVHLPMPALPPAPWGQPANVNEGPPAGAQGVPLPAPNAFVDLTDVRTRRVRGMRVQYE